MGFKEFACVAVNYRDKEVHLPDLPIAVYGISSITGKTLSGYYQ